MTELLDRFSLVATVAANVVFFVAVFTVSNAASGFQRQCDEAGGRVAAVTGGTDGSVCVDRNGTVLIDPTRK